MVLQVRGISRTCVGGVLDIASIIMEESEINYKIDKEDPLNRILPNKVQNF